MKRTLYIPFTVCILLFPACSGDLPEQQAGESRVLQLNFAQEGEATLVRNSNALTTENGPVTEIGLCITQGTGYDAYPGRTNTRYTFKTNGTGLCEGDGSSSTSTTFYLIGKDAHIQAFYPNSAVTPTNSDNGYTIPVTIPAEQTFTTTGGAPSCEAIDYLYGYAKNDVGDATLITTNAMQASPTNIYLHHALAKVMFTLQCDKDRTPNTEYDCVKSIKISAPSGSTPFLTGATGNSNSKMQINNGQISGLTNTDALTFTAATGSTPIAMGANGNPAIVACGLVAPLSAALTGDFTITVTLGKNGETTHDRTYTGTSKVFTQKWLAGYCYSYNLVLGSKLTAVATTVSWNTATGSDMEAKERGISSATELAAFAKSWAKNGDKGNDNATFYKDYGWYETDSKGNKVFTIKLTSTITVTATAGNSTENQWIPIGTQNKPLTIPFDGQGWEVVLQLNNNAMEITNQEYSGFIGYTTSDIKNLSIKTDPGSETVAGYNKIESKNAIYAGGMAGYVEGNIINCSIDLAGTSIVNTYSTSNNPMYLGGLVGYCKGNIYNSAVYTTPLDNGATPSVLFTSATANSCVGGLVGKMEKTNGGSGGEVTNCYTYIKGLGNSETTSGTSISAGWLVGDPANATFSSAFYIAGTATGCTPGDTPIDGITQKDNITGLCEALNAVATLNSWANWKEETISDDSKVILILR